MELQSNINRHIYSGASADAALIESTQNYATLRFKSATNTSGPTVGIDGAGGLQLDQKDTSKYIAFAIGSERLRILNDGNWSDFLIMVNSLLVLVMTYKFGLMILINISEVKKIN